MIYDNPECAITLPSGPQPGMYEALGAMGITIEGGHSGEFASDPVRAQEFINSYDPTTWLKQQACASVNARTAEIFADNFLYEGHEFDFDAMGRANIAAMAVAAGYSVANPDTFPWPSPFYWYSYENIAVPMTAAQMQAFGYAAGHYGSAIVQYACALTNQINAATTPAAVAAIDATGGWPVA